MMLSPRKAWKNNMKTYQITGELLKKLSQQIVYILKVDNNEGRRSYI